MISGIILGWSSFSSNASCIILTPIASGYCNAVTTVLPDGSAEVDLLCEEKSNDSITPATRCQLPSDIIPD